MFYAYVNLSSLGFTTLDALSEFMVVWLHLTPMRPCFYATIWVASCISLLSFVLCDDMLIVLIYAIRWLSMNLYMLTCTCMSLAC